MKVKESTLLLIGLLIPILLIFFILVTVYTPSLFIKPKYNFLYTTGYDTRYFIQNHRIQELLTDPPHNYYPSADIYLYDTARNTSRQITYAEAQQYYVDGSKTSPDNYQVIDDQYYNYDPDFFFPWFWSRPRSRGIYLEHNGHRRELNTLPASYYNFKFLSWVTE